MGLTDAAEFVGSLQRLQKLNYGAALLVNTLPNGVGIQFSEDLLKTVGLNDLADTNPSGFKQYYLNLVTIKAADNSIPESSAASQTIISQVMAAERDAMIHGKAVFNTKIDASIIDNMVPQFKDKAKVITFYHKHPTQAPVSADWSFPNPPWPWPAPIT
uniref:Uncharacterized protein n=1 Tax=viral metagenome TaxID=1070528 RepID=A0A6C0BA15_9ZZZZ